MTSKAVQKKNDMKAILNSALPSLAEVAPEHLKPERLVKLMLATMSRTPKIGECTAESILQFCLKCSETGLEPIGAGGAWPIPYGKELTFVPDYRGLVNAAIHAGCIKNARAYAVYEHDTFSYHLGLNPDLQHVPATGDRGDLIGAYCVYAMPDGERRFEFMSAEEIEAIRKRSKASSGPWQTDTSEMYKKTVTRRAMKPFAGASQHFDKAVEYDNAASGLREPIEREAVPMPEPIETTATNESTEPDSVDDLPFFDDEKGAE